jgi:GIY-YIG catalytic domain
MAVIYGLVHIASGKTYIGCTAGKLAKRFREHRCLLNNGKHKETGLQLDWSIYGSNSFRIGVLEELPLHADVKTKREAEIRWMDALDAEGLLYNRFRASFGFTPEATRRGVEASRFAGRPVSAEGRLKRRMAQLGIPKNHGHKISATKRRNRMLRATEEIV